MDALGNRNYVAATPTKDSLPLVYTKLANSDPGLSNDTTEGFIINSEWINLNESTIWKAVEVAAGAAKWVQIAKAHVMSLYIDDLGNGATQGFNRSNFGSGADSEVVYQFFIPPEWDSSKSPIVIATGLNSGTSSGNYRFHWGYESLAQGEAAGGTDVESIDFNNSGTNINHSLEISVPQSLTAANIAIGDYMRLTFARLGTDGVNDTKGGTFHHTGIKVIWPI